MSQQVVTDINCPSCNSSLPLNPEDVIITCKYCASSFTAGRNKIEEHLYFPATISKSGAEKKIFEFLKGKLRFRGWKEYKGIMLDKMLLPYWMVKYKATSHYRGYKRTTRTKQESYTDSEGNRKTRTKTVTVYEPVNRTINDDTFEPLLCRNGIRIFGLNKLNKTILESIGSQKYENFSSEKLMDEPEDINFLSGEILSFEAKELAESIVQDRHRNIARSNTTELFDCRTRVEVQGMSFLHYPVISGEYSYGDHTYRILMDAHTGEIIDAEYPVTFRFRMTNLLITFLTLIGASTLAFTMGSTPLEENDAAVGIIIGLLIFGVISFFTNRLAWATETR